MEGARVVRRVVLRAGRYGEPDQGAVLAVRRSGERGNDASQPNAAVPVGDGLCVGEWVSATRFASDRTGTRPSGNDSDQAAQDWRSDTRHREEGVGIDGFQLPMARPL